MKRHKGRAEKKKEKSQRALLAGGEKCCKLTELFLKSSAASASASANTASTDVSDTAEPAHQGERRDREEYEPQEDEEVDMENCVTVRHVFIMERLALMIYWIVFSTAVVHCCGALVYCMGVHVHHHWGYQQCVFFTCSKVIWRHKSKTLSHDRAVFSKKFNLHNYLQQMVDSSIW